MPLIVLCGRPTTGKSQRASELETYFRDTCAKPTILIIDESFASNKSTPYKDRAGEKNLRAHLKSNAERAVSRDTVVILDAMNYIKGYRYELYCIARSQRTPHCIVYCDTTLEQAREWNTANEEAHYEAELFEDLSRRFETPNERNRWDAPLFTVKPDEPTPYEAIKEALLQRAQKPPNIATIPQKLSDTNFVYELDKATQEIVSAILEAQGQAVVGDCFSVPKATLKFHLSRNVTLSELRRVRQQFLKITQMHPPKVEDIGNVFVEYLNTTLAT
eukprot:TRINITY_DN8444_c0_g1_i2.p1 TRINITY_DN8444_c0_g1~~TRINITY_DN8444_c0_g1_i2.p1  ORF type:complete len:275 (-),score=38.61 TRINITY_DN8444_c0_g1_i2:50-874(-)